MPMEWIATSIDESLKSCIREIPDFPIPGILFKDIAPMLAERSSITKALDALETAVTFPVDVILAIDARGFVLGAPLADRLGTGFVMIRKPGKLPGGKLTFDYQCEYSTGRLEVSEGLVRPGMRCLIVDDVLATGGTARATADFALAQGAEVAGYSFLLEIGVLGGRSRLTEGPVISLLRY
jgi:adenine phosphoribosyltransferase